MDNPSERLLLKDQLFNKEKIDYVSSLIKAVYSDFDCGKFEHDVLTEFPQFELKERISWMQVCLEEQLPDDFNAAIAILSASLQEKRGREDFVFAAYLEYVEMHGCNEKYLEKSLATMGEFTEFFSAEFAIRRFINEFPNETFAQFERWARSENTHQRRLASEGIRPRLPWGKGIDFDYKKVAGILDVLFCDDERYVTRSVANHLNDISKFDPDFVVGVLKRWKESKKQNEKEMNYIIQHALRTSIKRGHVGTLAFLGFSNEPAIVVNALAAVGDSLQLGERLEFSFEIEALADEQLIVDYKIIYPNPRNKHSEKVFKIKTCSLMKGEVLRIEKKHLFRLMTTKKLYAGDHRLEIQINGKMFDSIGFHLQI